MGRKRFDRRRLRTVDGLKEVRYNVVRITIEFPTEIAVWLKRIAFTNGFNVSLYCRALIIEALNRARKTGTPIALSPKSLAVARTLREGYELQKEFYGPTPIDLAQEAVDSGGKFPG